MHLLPRRTREEILTPEVLLIIQKVCDDYKMPIEEILCKTSMHKAAYVRKIITYVLFTFLKINRFDLALLMYVDPVTIWCYKEKINLETMHNPKFEEKLKNYTLNN